MTRMLTRTIFLTAFAVMLVLAHPLPGFAQGSDGNDPAATAPLVKRPEAPRTEAQSREKTISDSDKANTQKAIQPAKANPGAKRDETHTGKDPLSADSVKKADAKPLSDAQKNAAITTADGITAYAPEKVVGEAKPWQLYFQEASSPVMDAAVPLSNYVLGIAIVVSIFVLILLAYVILRFNKRRNPVAQTFTHNKLVEIVWTVIPILILVSIAIPSLRLHYHYYNNETIISEADLTLKVVGHQWYWSYEYPDEGIAFDSNIKADKELVNGEPRLLTVDNPVVVPVNKVVRVQITAADVMHAWALPAFGIKKGAIPGRLNETWFKAEKPGIYYGQCSILCGKSHGFMPIMIVAVSDQDYAAWVKGAKLKFATSNHLQFASLN